MKMKLQRSKDTFCDYLLAKMWQSFLNNSSYDETCDFDLIKNLNSVSDFMHYLRQFYSITETDLKQFGIKSDRDIQAQLTYVYRNLIDNGVDF